MTAGFDAVLSDDGSFAESLAQSLEPEGDWDWQKRGLCREVDSGDLFYPERGGSTREAKRVCFACEVRSECLEYALERQEKYGIWGGLSEAERRKLLGKQPKYIPSTAQSLGA